MIKYTLKSALKDAYIFAKSEAAVKNWCQAVSDDPSYFRFTAHHVLAAAEVLNEMSCLFMDNKTE